MPPQTQDTGIGQSRWVGPLPDGRWIEIPPGTSEDKLRALQQRLSAYRPRRHLTEEEQAPEAQGRAWALAQQTGRRAAEATEPGEGEYSGAYAPTGAEREYALTHRMPPGPFQPPGVENRPSFQEMMDAYREQFPILSGSRTPLGYLLRGAPDPMAAVEWAKEKMRPMQERLASTAKAPPAAEPEETFWDKMQRPQEALPELLYREPINIVKGLTEPEDTMFGGISAAPGVRALEELKRRQYMNAALSAADQAGQVVGLPSPFAPLQAHAEHFKKSPWGAVGATLADTIAMAYPWIRSPKTGEFMFNPEKLEYPYQITKEMTLEPMQVDQLTANFLNLVSKENLTPAQYATRLSQHMDEITELAGRAHGQSVTDIERQAPEVRVTYPNTINVLQTEIGVLRALKERNPVLFGEMDGPSAVMLRILETELKSVQQEAASAGHRNSPPNIRVADQRRSDYAALRRELIARNIDPATARRVVSRLNMALAEDVTSAVGAGHPDLAQNYIATSNRYRQLNDFVRDKTLQKVFGDAKYLGPDRVLQVIRTNPEHSLQAIRGLYQGNPQEIQLFRRQMVQWAVEEPKFWDKMPKNVRGELFGPYEQPITDFMNALKAPKTDAVLQGIREYAPVVVGGWRGIVTKFLLRRGRGPSETAVEIPVSELAKIEKSVRALKLAEQGLLMSQSDPRALGLRQQLMAMFPAMGVQTSAEKTLDEQLREVESGPTR